MKWIRRARWPILALVVGSIGVTVALASSLAVTSKQLTVLRTCVLTGSSILSTSDVDTTVHQDASILNFGTATTMDVQSRNAGRNHRLYMRFDLTKCSPVIASSASVQLASLRLWISSLPGSCRTYDLFRVTATWAEITITWNNQPFGTSENNPPGASAAATASVGPSPCGVSATGYVTWTVTSNVQAFVSGSSNNFGWMIRDDVEGASGSQVGTFPTKELATLSQSPQLVVNYS
jgi:hypothetical protein